MLLLPECVVESEWEVLSLPSSRQVVLTSAGKLLELVVLERRLGSWLLDETLVASGRLFVATVRICVCVFFLPSLVFTSVFFCCEGPGSSVRASSVVAERPVSSSWRCAL